MNNRLTVTDYVIKVNGEFKVALNTLREARKGVKALAQEISRTNQKIGVVEIIKRTTTQTIKDVYRPKQVNTLMAEDLDKELLS